ncbi:MAG: RNA polymerase sigma factor [Ignavibacteriales bacterium]|nr:RNA polymerase sigma factor [Ignavibacteriales bacterium]
MTEKTDYELVDGFKNGNDKCFNELVNRYKERVYWTARRVVTTHQDADDVVQDVFVNMYDGLKDFRGDSNLFTWLYRITINVSLNLLRKNKIRQFIPYEGYIEDLLPSSETADAKIMTQEYQTALEQAILSLPSKQKAVFTMRYYDELPFKDISKILKKSVGGTKANYFQAVKKISDKIRKEFN